MGKGLVETWKNPTTATSDGSFIQEYPTEFRTSAIEGAGNGWWAKVDIPKGVRLRRVAVDEGNLYRFGNEEELRATGWDIDDAFHYGIGHKGDRGAIYYLNPSTCCNHADRTRRASVRYNTETPKIMEIWTIKDVKAGEELLTDYGENLASCDWYDKLCEGRGLVPLNKLPAEIEKMYGESRVYTVVKSPAGYGLSAVH